ncbi:MAG: NADH-ubiquinone oxidoreductase-F iron-sulfur binding region domain-containing protein [Dermatophilaceae bacterium]
MTAAATVGMPVTVDIRRGPRLLAAAGSQDQVAQVAQVAQDEGLSGHRTRWPDPRGAGLTADHLVEQARAIGLAGRGGAGFPFATKLAAAASSARLLRRPIVVVNAAEGEPASAKDYALALTAPHLVLDGAAAAAYALRCSEIHVVTPRERPEVRDAYGLAVTQRREAGERLSWHLTETGPGFVAGQARAVIEALSGRPGLPVTAWQPEALSGFKGRPTLLSNAETWAHVGALVGLGVEGYRRLGTPQEPGTTLLSLSGSDGGIEVVEIPYGTAWVDVLGEAAQRPALVGGYHGTWAAAGSLASLTVSRTDLRDAGLTLGAGVVLTPAAGECPVVVTAAVTAYLAGETAGRCGPCFNGLPALTAEVDALARCNTGASYSRIAQLAGLVTGRGACAHPDGTARLVRSMVTVFDDEVAAHLGGVCRVAETAGVAETADGDLEAAP